MSQLNRIRWTGPLLAFAAVLAGACSETAPTGPEPSGDADAVRPVITETSNMNGVEMAASGVGHLWSPEPGSEMRPALRRFTIAAVRQVDGSVSGHYNVVTAGGAHVEGVVTCINVVGDRAFIGGTFRNGPPLPFTPVGVAIEVVDGTPTGASDQISGVGIFAAELGATEADVQQYCDTAIPGPVSPIDLGSITVR